MQEEMFQFHVPDASSAESPSHNLFEIRAYFETSCVHLPLRAPGSSEQN
jgi:hypothetical protein